MKIYKYPIEITDEQVVKMPLIPDDTPLPQDILHVGLDPFGQPCIWAKVDPDQPMVSVTIRITGAGQDVPNGVHIGTFVVPPGRMINAHKGTYQVPGLVWHVFVKD